MEKNYHYLGNFENADFIRYLHLQYHLREDYISKLDSICKYVDTDTITDDFLKMLKIFKDGFVYSPSWEIGIGVTDAHIKLADVKIELSEDIEEHTYQGIEFNRGMILEILSQIREREERPDNDNEKNILEFDNSLFGSKTDIILGRYNHSNRTITLYIKAVLKCITGKYSKADKYTNFAHRLLAVFVHELFHAYHACDYDSYGHCWNKDAQENEIIVESLAAYFEWCFLWHELGRHDMSGSMETEWRKHACIVWPYAGAKYIQHFITKNHDIDRLYYHFNNRYYSHYYDRYLHQLKPMYKRFRESAHIYGGRRRMIFYKLSLLGLGYAQTNLMDYEIDELLYPNLKPFLKRG